MQIRTQATIASILLLSLCSAQLMGSEKQIIQDKINALHSARTNVALLQREREMIQEKLKKQQLKGARVEQEIKQHIDTDEKLMEELKEQREILSAKLSATTGKTKKPIRWMLNKLNLILPPAKRPASVVVKPTTPKSQSQSPRVVPAPEEVIVTPAAIVITPPDLMHPRVIPAPSAVIANGEQVSTFVLSPLIIDQSAEKAPVSSTATTPRLTPLSALESPSTSDDTQKLQDALIQLKKESDATRIDASQKRSYAQVASGVQNTDNTAQNSATPPSLSIIIAEQSAEISAPVRVITPPASPMAQSTPPVTPASAPVDTTIAPSVELLVSTGLPVVVTQPELPAASATESEGAQQTLPSTPAVASAQMIVATSAVVQAIIAPPAAVEGAPITSVEEKIVTPKSQPQSPSARIEVEALKEMLAQLEKKAAQDAQAMKKKIEELEAALKQDGYDIVEPSVATSPDTLLTKASSPASTDVEQKKAEVAPQTAPTSDNGWLSWIWNSSSSSAPAAASTGSSAS